MNAIRVLVYKGFSRYIRNKTAVALTFFVPIAMIYIFGQVFGLNRKETGPVGVRLAVVNETPNPTTNKLVDMLKAEKAFTVITEKTNADGTRQPLIASDLRPMIANGAFRFAVVIPPGTGSGERFGIHLKILSNPQNEIETQTVNGLLQKTIFSRVPELLSQSVQANARHVVGEQRMNAFNDAIASAIATAFGGDRARIRDTIERGDFGLSALSSSSGTGSTSSEAAKASNDLLSRLISIETEQVVGRNVKSPAATRVVGGWAIMFLMFALNGAATSLFEEKKSGMFQRLLAAPVRRSDILWSRFIFGVILGLVQLITIFAVGSMLYGIDVASHVGNLAVVCIAAAAACTALGMFIASISSSQEAAMGIATFVVLTMSACGGAWFPISFMPPFMQQVGKCTVTYWAMEGFGEVLWAGKNVVQTLPTIAILLGIAAALMAAATWRFNRGRLFD